MTEYRGWFGRHARRRCPHSHLIGIYGDQINRIGGWRLGCLDCMQYLDGPVTLAETRKREHRVSTPNCDTFWGSHGCDLPPGHDGPHICGAEGNGYGLCSKAEGQAGEDGLVWFYGNDGWSDEPWPGWRLFSNRGPEHTR